MGTLVLPVMLDTLVPPAMSDPEKLKQGNHELELSLGYM